MGRLRPSTLRTTERPAKTSRPTAPAGSPELAAGSVTSGQMAMTREAAWTASPTTTTDTVNWTTVTSVGIFVPEGPWALFIFTQAQWSHTVANADVGWRIIIYDSATTVQLRSYPTTFTAATAGDLTTMALSVGIDVTASGGSIKRGPITMALQGRPVTAGTLTVSADASIHGLASGANIS